MSKLGESCGEEDVVLARFLSLHQRPPAHRSSDGQGDAVVPQLPGQARRSRPKTRGASGRTSNRCPRAASAKRWSFVKSSRDSTEAAAAAAQASVSAGNAAIGDEESKLAARRVNAVGCSTRIRACQWA